MHYICMQTVHCVYDCANRKEHIALNCRIPASSIAVTVV